MPTNREPGRGNAHQHNIGNRPVNAPSAGTRTSQTGPNLQRRGFFCSTAMHRETRHEMSPSGGGPVSTTEPKALTGNAEGRGHGNGHGRGQVCFVGETRRASLYEELAAAGFLVIHVEGTSPAYPARPARPARRSALSDQVGDAIDRAIRARGGPGPGLIADGDRDATLGDQLFRARRVGATGLAPILHGLHDTARELGALDPVDTSFIAFLAAATRARPLVVVLDERDRAAPA